MATEDQQMEIDMMMAMYAESFTALGNTPPSYSMTVGSEPEEPAELKITITYPPGYPEKEAVIVQVECISDKKRIQVEKLNEELKGIAVEHQGMHSVVALLQRAQEFLVEINALAVEQSLKAVHVECDPTIRLGTSVTKEVFAEWKAKWTAEKLLRNAKKDGAVASKLTGRQLWDTTVKQTDWELFADAAEGDGADLEDCGYEFVLEEEDDGDTKQKPKEG